MQRRMSCTTPDGVARRRQTDRTEYTDSSDASRLEHACHHARETAERW